MSRHLRMGLVTFLAAFAVLFLLVGKGSAASLSDIPFNAATEINYLLDRGIITGYPDGTFRPDQNLTRDEAAIMIGRSLELDDTQRATAFPDVSVQSLASGYIQSAYEQGIINGKVDGTYGLKDPMTRGQMAFLLQRAFDLTETSYVFFFDIALSGTQYEAIDKIATAGLTNGYADGTFRPSANVTRAEFARFVARGLNSSFRVAIADRDRIAIDPGHGGNQPGAIGINGLIEKELNLAVALKVEQLVKQMGIEVVMTRRDDSTLGLIDRVNIAVNAHADAFVSIHGNSYSSESASGTETYFSTASTRSEDSRQLATFIQNRLYPALGTSNRGVDTADYKVIAENPLPAALVELGFISNSSDASKLASDYYRYQAAQAIALGIQDYYNWKN